MDTRNASTPAAKAIPGRPSGVCNADDGNEYLAFRLGEQEYAFDILDVREIRQFEPPTRVLGSAPHALGVLKLRGSVVPILDLRLRVGLVARFSHQTMIVVVGVPSGRVGLVVDAVSDVVTLSDSQIQPMPSLYGSRDGGLFQGLARTGQGAQQRSLVLMNVQNLLAAPKTPARVGGLSSFSLLSSASVAA